MSAKMDKTFPTLAVATAATGVGLTSMPFSAVHEICEHVIGHPVWTHELGHGAVTDRIRDLLLAQFPELPSPELANEDWQAAAKKATDAYGETMTVPHGSEERAAHPINTLVEKVGADRVIVLTLPPASEHETERT